MGDPAPDRLRDESEKGERWTPGPWHVTFGNLVRVRQVGSTSVIAGIHTQGRYTGKPDFDQVQANAELIAAAPDLFDALTRLVEEYEYGEWQSSIIDMARGALAKAAAPSAATDPSDTHDG